jgi:hypothetical protein
MSCRCGLAVLLLASVAIERADAQNPPARLPAVVVNATPNLPGPRKVAGVVRDTTGFPVEGVEISIPELRLRSVSLTNGDFRFENIKPGTYEVRARRLGFAPQVREVKVDTAGGALAFALMPITQSMLPVVTVAARGGLSGVVGDTAFNPLEGVMIEVAGHNDRAITDSLGAFHIPLKPGTYTVSVKQPGFGFKVVSAMIPPDSGRRVTVYLTPQLRPPNALEVHILEDLSNRLAWRSNQNSRVYTRAELQAKEIEWVTDAVQMGFGTFGANRPILDRDCFAVKNGGPGSISLKELTIDEIDMVEVYLTAPTASMGTQAARTLRASRGPSIPLGNTREAGLRNRGRNCTTVYVWLR